MKRDNPNDVLMGRRPNPLFFGPDQQGIVFIIDMFWHNLTFSELIAKANTILQIMLWIQSRSSKLKLSLPSDSENNSDFTRQILLYL